MIQREDATAAKVIPSGSTLRVRPISGINWTRTTTGSMPFITPGRILKTLRQSRTEVTSVTVSRILGAAEAMAIPTAPRSGIIRARMTWVSRVNMIYAPPIRKLAMVLAKPTLKLVSIPK